MPNSHEQFRAIKILRGPRTGELAFRIAAAAIQVNPRHQQARIKALQKKQGSDEGNQKLGQRGPQTAGPI